jgi:hypothetical protein
MAATQSISLPAYSMFTNTPVYEINGEVVFGLLRDAVVADATDRLYTIPQGGDNRLWLISQYHYSTPELWWVLSMVNNIVDPLAGVPAGTELRVPTINRLINEGILS